MSARSFLEDLVDQAADYYGISRELVRSLVATESNWRPDVVSDKGAVGLMQVMPSTALWLADDDVAPLHRLDLPEGLTRTDWAALLLDPELNALIGVGYLVRLLRRFGDARLAVAAYNGGEGLVSKLLRNHGGTFEGLRDHLPDQTRDYVSKVFRALDGQGRSWLGIAVAGALLAGGLALLRRRQ